VSFPFNKFYYNRKENRWRMRKSERWEIYKNRNRHGTRNGCKKRRKGKVNAI
jgi:hypothetical protein